MIRTVNTVATAIKPTPDRPLTGVSRWPSAFFRPDMTGEDMLAEFRKSIDDFIADNGSPLIAKYGWR